MQKSYILKPKKEHRGFHKKWLKKNPKLKRNIAIAIGLIIVLIVAVSVGVYLMGGGSIGVNLTPIDFNMSISSSSGTVVQGGSIQTSVAINYISGSKVNVEVVGDAGSSGIHCNLDPITKIPDFTSTLTMDVPESTPTDTYSVIVTATGSGTTHTVAYTLSVLSANVYVSGTVTTTGLGTQPTQVQFVDKQTGITYTASMSGDSYSITLKNQHTYNVVCYWSGFLGSSGTFSGGSLYVNAGVGSTSMTKSFSD